MGFLDSSVFNSKLVVNSVSEQLIQPGM